MNAAARNVEIKARVASIAALEPAVARLSDRGSMPIAQDDTFFHQVDGLGRFVELEVVLGHDQNAGQGEVVASALLAASGIDVGQLIGPAYIDLLEHKDTSP